MQPTPRQVAILGAGPIGLQAALACADAGWDYTVYESGERAGAAVRRWGHVRLFTPWERNVSDRMRARFAAAPAGPHCPTGAELVSELLEPLAALSELTDRIHYRSRVVAVAREGLLKHEAIGTDARATAAFRLLVDTPSGERVTRADLVLDCTGTYHNPNTLGDGGIPAPGERALDERITRTLPDTTDAARWAGTVLLVGAGKSAQTAARDLAALPDTTLEWVVRDPDPDWGEIPADSLPERQRLVDVARGLTGGASDRVSVHTGTTVDSLAEHRQRIRVGLHTPDGRRELLADHVVSLTGYAADATLYRQLQVHECYATAAPMNLAAALLGTAGGDCLAQPSFGVDTLRNPEPHFFVLGIKSYGRTNTFLLRVGYTQVDQIIADYQHPPAH